MLTSPSAGPDLAANAAMSCLVQRGPRGEGPSPLVAREWPVAVTCIASDRAADSVVVFLCACATLLRAPPPRASRLAALLGPRSTGCVVFRLVVVGGGKGAALCRAGRSMLVFRHHGLLYSFARITQQQMHNRLRSPGREAHATE